MDLDRLETSARELFVDNIRLQRGSHKDVYVNPLNVEAVMRSTPGYITTTDLVPPIGRRRKAARLRAEQARSPVPSFELSLSATEYCARMQTFNASFGDHVRVKTYGEGAGMRVVAVFPENPLQVAERLVRDGPALGLPLSTYQGRLAPYVHRTTDTSGGEYIDLLLERHLIGSEVPFTTGMDEREHACILPYLFPQLSLPVMKLYVASRQA